MTTQTQERQVQETSAGKALPWGTLPQVERIRVRQEIQQVCKSGGLHRENLVLRIAAVLESQEDKHLDPLLVEAWEINVRRSSGAWGDTFKEGRISIRYNVACDIVNWLVAKKYLIDHGSDGIVICAGFPDRPAD